MVSRDLAVDRLRGLVIALMALDHARDFFGARRDPTDLATTTPALFLTRFVTHYCAPTFILLAGVSAGLQERRGDDRRRIARFVASRGLFLVLLELTVVRFAWTFDPTWSFTPLQVIWAIGWSMIALAGIVLLPRAVAWVIAIGMIAGHGLLDPIRFGPSAVARGLESILHRPALFEVVHGHFVYVVYPLVPWIGVMALGWAMEPILRREDRRRLLVVAGLASVALFVVLRALNRYGDLHPWVPQGSTVRTSLAFLNVEKYPPSLDYLLVTLGPALVALASLDRFGKVLEVFGKVPLFFYVAHLYLLHLAAVLVRLAMHAPPASGRGPSAGAVGASLPVVYLVWLAALALLYEPCRRYAALKARRRDIALLRYL